MAYNQNFNSPILKALVGKQKNLPQHLKEAILASPAQKNENEKGGKNKNIAKGTVNAARQLLSDTAGINNPNLSDSEVIRAAKVKGVYNQASSQAKRAVASGENNYAYTPVKKYKK